MEYFDANAGARRMPVRFCAIVGVSSIHFQMLKKAPPIDWPMLIMKGFASTSVMRIAIRRQITPKTQQILETLVVAFLFDLIAQIDFK